MFSNDTKNWLVILKNRNKNWKILTNFWKFSDIFSFFSYLSAQKGNSVFSRSSANFSEDSRSRGMIKSIPRGIEEWIKFRDLEDRGTRNSSCHPYSILYKTSFNKQTNPKGTILMTTISSLRFLYILGGSGLLCGALSSRSDQFQIKKK